MRRHFLHHTATKRLKDEIKRDLEHGNRDAGLTDVVLAPIAAAQASRLPLAIQAQDGGSRQKRRSSARTTGSVCCRTLHRLGLCEADYELDDGKTPAPSGRCLSNLMGAPKKRKEMTAIMSTCTVLHHARMGFLGAAPQLKYTTSAAIGSAITG